MAQAVVLKKLNHVAWRCIDAEQTRQFYEDILGLPLAHTVKSDHVPSTGEYAPYFHLFFELGDGSYIAFFDIRDGKGATLSPDMPAWVHHFAFEVDTIEEVKAMKARLEKAGIDVIGVTDHHFIQSIYFFDPNGHRIELACNIGTPGQHAELRSLAPVMLEEWSRTRRAPRHAAWLHQEPSA
jgi:catechol 2,3-dioxygenase-like lactoylglutathione lyase family enzyme